MLQLKASKLSSEERFIVEVEIATEAVSIGNCDVILSARRLATYDFVAN